jgi:hypothetical protein
MHAAPYSSVPVLGMPNIRPATEQVRQITVLDCNNIPIWHLIICDFFADLPKQARSLALKQLQTRQHTTTDPEHTATLAATLTLATDSPITIMAPVAATTQDIVLAIFHFYPSEGAAGAFLALFFIAALLNSYVTARTRTPFMAWVGITGLLEVCDQHAPITSVLGC